MPDWLLLMFFIVVPAVAAMGVHVIVRRNVPSSRLIPHHDVAGYLISIVGVLYGVVLGFLVVSSWESFDAAQRNADLEAGQIAAAWGFSTFLPQPQSTTVRHLLADYAYEVRDVEWPAMREGKQDPRARRLLQAALYVVETTRVRANQSPDEAARQRSQIDGVIDDIRNAFDGRRHRLDEAEGEDRIPAAMYLALVFGAVMLMAFVFLFGVDSQALQLTMTGIVAGCIGLLFGLIVELNSPYAGAIHVSSIAWTYVIENNNLTR